MRTKSITIWALTSLTFISLVHLIEAITVITLNNPIRLTQLYPFINEPLKALTPATYFWITAITTCVLWGITCMVAFHNPVELYLQRHEVTETQLQDKSDALDRVCETVESDHQTLTQLSDLIRKMQKDQNPEQETLPTKTMLKENSVLKRKPLRLKRCVSKPTVHVAEDTEKLQEKPLLTQKLEVSKKKNENQKPRIETPISYYN